MMTKVRHILLAAAVLTLSGGVASAYETGPRHRSVMKTVPMSQSFAPQQSRQLPRWAQNRISAAQAKSVALRRYPGATYLDTIDQGSHYRVILMMNGSRIDVYVDASTGRIR